MANSERQAENANPGAEQHDAQDAMREYEQSATPDGLGQDVRAVSGVWLMES